MGPHSFKCGKFKIQFFAFLEIAPLQWGRTLSSAERRSERFAPDAQRIASMGPHSFKCGKFTILFSSFSFCSQLQWGRTLSSAERANTDSQTSRRSNRFNGAALFQVRKALFCFSFRSSASQASMGPHSFKCGKLSALRLDCQNQDSFNGAALFQVRKAKMIERPRSRGRGFNGAALFQVRKGSAWPLIQSGRPTLQWGRTLSSAESGFASDGGQVRCHASMGPHSFKCGKTTMRIESVPNEPSLQWGRTLSSAESRQGKRPTQPEPTAASMGPHSFKCGKAWRDAECGRTNDTLQWGRTLSSAERKRKYRRVWSNFQTNDTLQWGRTLSSAERTTRTLSSAPTTKGFNGAALFQVRKEVNDEILVGPNSCASMGPHSFKCGKLVFCMATIAFKKASMGPHSFKCGKRGQGLFYPPIRRRSFNGAALFQVRKVASGDFRFYTLSLPLQWGRTLSSAESLKSWNLRFSLRMLQWGRTLSSAESMWGSVFSRFYFVASMGPHSFKCGKIQMLTRYGGERLGLQWGRTLSSAERPLTRPNPRPNPIRLQWGRTLSSAESQQAQPVRQKTLSLQWGRTLSSAESIIRDTLIEATSIASMGPHSFKCGKSV